MNDVLKLNAVLVPEGCSIISICLLVTGLLLMVRRLLLLVRY